jgi:hypothetical protein
MRPPGHFVPGYDRSGPSGTFRNGLGAKIFCKCPNSSPGTSCLAGTRKPCSGNKETLFRKALDRYMEKTVAFMLDATNKRFARQFAERLLHSAAGRVRSSADFSNLPLEPAPTIG